MTKLETIRNLIRKSQTGSGTLQDQEQLEKLLDESVDLGFHERCSLLSISHAVNGRIVYDPGAVLSADVSINDSPIIAKGRKKSKHRERPLALIKMSIGSHVAIEVIDILESVRMNAGSIGHPIVVMAIERWQEILRSSKHLLRKNIYDNDPEIADLKHRIGSRPVEIAEKNLSALSKALLGGAKRDAVSKESVLRNEIDRLNVNDPDNYLHLAWERLARNVVEQTDEYETRLRKIIDFLEASETLEESSGHPNHLGKTNRIVDNTRISFEDVESFLRARGRIYIYSEENVSAGRPNWPTFRNAFVAWYLNLRTDTVRTYVKRSASDRTTRELYDQPVFGNSRESTLFSQIFSTLNIPLVNYCPAIVAPDLSSIDLDRHIEETRIR